MDALPISSALANSRLVKSTALSPIEAQRLAGYESGSIETKAASSRSNTLAVGLAGAISRRFHLRIERRKDQSHLHARRRWGCGSALPADLRCLFTPGQNAVAAVIRREVERHGSCRLIYSVIAKCAGLASTTIVKQFVRIARQLGIISVQYRSAGYRRNRANVITISGGRWKSWINSPFFSGERGTEVPTYLKEDKRKKRTDNETLHNRNGVQSGSRCMGSGEGESGYGRTQKRRC